MPEANTGKYDSVRSIIVKLRSRTLSGSVLPTGLIAMDFSALWLVPSRDLDDFDPEAPPVV